MTAGFPRVLDLTDDSLVYATRLLSDLGAQVIRVEAPQPDAVRRWRLPAVDGAGGGVGGSREAGGNAGEGAFLHEFANAGKRSVALDVSSEAGQQVLLRLCAQADIVLEGLTPAVDAQTFYPQARRLNPRLTWVAVRDFADPPASGRQPAPEIVLCALTSLMSITGPADGPPMVAGGGTANALVALYAALAGYMGYMAAVANGEGQYVWVSAYEALLAVAQQGVLEGAVAGKPVRRAGAWHAHVGVSGAVPTRDGHVVVSSNSEAMWQGIVDLVGDERLRDEKFSSDRQRAQHRAEAYDLIGQWSRHHATRDLAESGQNLHLPFGPLQSLHDVLRDPHLRARGFFHALGPGREMPILTTPWGKPPDPAPRLGQHTAAVLAQAGYGVDEIRQLAATGLITTEEA